MIDPDCDEEVAGITNGQSQHQVNISANANTDSDPSNQDLGLKQVSDTNSTNNLGTLYNQDFFIADTMNRRLSQIPNKVNYPYPLPNGHAALQHRLLDLLIYLKTDTYLMDVNTGEHYAVYSDKIQKMSITPKLYSAWGYGQFSLETPMQMLMRDKQNQVLQNHVVAVNAVFNKVAVFEELIQQEPHNAMYYEEVQ